jgi:hypothetical protein
MNSVAYSAWIDLECVRAFRADTFNREQGKRHVNHVKVGIDVNEYGPVIALDQQGDISVQLLKSQFLESQP